MLQKLSVPQSDTNRIDTVEKLIATPMMKSVSQVRIPVEFLTFTCVQIF